MAGSWVEEYLSSGTEHDLLHFTYLISLKPIKKHQPKGQIYYLLGDWRTRFDLEIRI